MSTRENLSRFEDICDEIRWNYEDENNIDGPPLTKSLEQKMKLWIQWFEEDYPSQEPWAILKMNEDKADFRVFFLAHPRPGFGLLRLLEVYYYIDKALCGTSAKALEDVKMLWSMDSFDYLSSEDHAIWWEAALCELNDSIEDGDCGDLRVQLQFHRVVGGAKWLKNLSEDLEGNCWAVLRQASEDGYYVPDIYEKVEASIHASDILLTRSAEVLTTSFEKANLRSGTRSQVKSAERSEASLRTQGVANEGIRRRLPFERQRSQTPSAMSPTELPDSYSTSSELLLEPNGNDPIVQSVESSRRWNPSIVRNLSQTFTKLSPRLAASKDRLAAYAAALKCHLGTSGIIAFAIHKSTALIIFSALTVIGGAFAVLSTNQSQQQTSGFLTSISQTSFSLLSVYLTVLPPLRSRSLHLRYPFWFWGCLTLSSMTSILCTAVYFRSATAAIIFGFVSSFAQVVCSLLLVECIEEAVKAGHIGDGQLETL